MSTYCTSFVSTVFVTFDAAKYPTHHSTIDEAFNSAFNHAYSAAFFRPVHPTDHNTVDATNKSAFSPTEHNPFNTTF
jgi:hypothetical protein